MNNLFSDVSRRKFITVSTASAALAAAQVTRVSATSNSPSANDRLRIGFIGVGGRCQQHLDSAARLQNEDGTVEIAAVCDVFNRYRDRAVQKVTDATKKKPTVTADYRDIINDKTIDAVCIATPDHWHAKQTLDALAAGKHVYCEKPMTHTVEEALEVYKTWKKSGLVMQVGVQSTQLPVWEDARRRICEGQLGKVVQYQTEIFRNSDMGQWRYYELTEDMTPKNVDWKMFLGTDFGLAPDMPFDRAKFGQWRCYWPFGSGLFTDLFVHRTTSMLAATGLRFPGRVTGAGGIFLEYDERNVPDVATVVADFHEGVQGFVTATMACQETPLNQTIRGHHGSFVFGSGEVFAGYDFVAERPQVTHDSSIKSERIEVSVPEDTTFAHFKNFCEAAREGDPVAVKCDPEMGASAMVIVKLGSESYRQGKIFHFDPKTMKISDGNSEWASNWESMSAQRASAHHVPGWSAGETGSKLIPKDYQRLEGPWVNGVDPASKS
ncbi:Gfo/Idh/MocA family protein [Bythopirellula polymerisocia]|uniref:Inositol 2-dehydrogenase n=1 Tax=Bythopirellula polymerisocia TaxID=2528003 RepID=A0A5C6CHH7_9BACT|nr:Gfo/Idh/MocA family oxidoreductase [Bythopirellula polymerisocia]TWU23652.1 Inositol 2-dehydrogenase [Bythopirellula polymerisocia]